MRDTSSGPLKWRRDSGNIVHLPMQPSPSPRPLRPSLRVPSPLPVNTRLSHKAWQLTYAAKQNAAKAPMPTIFKTNRNQDAPPLLFALPFRFPLAWAPRLLPDPKDLVGGRYASRKVREWVDTDMILEDELVLAARAGTHSCASDTSPVRAENPMNGPSGRSILCSKQVVQSSVFFDCSFNCTSGPCSSRRLRPT